MNYYWKVTPKVSLLFFAMGLIGLGYLGSGFDLTNKLWFGYMAAGIMMHLAYK